LSQGEHHFKSVLNDSLIKDTTLVVNREFYKEGGMINMSEEQYGGQAAANMSHLDQHALGIENPHEHDKAKHLKIVLVDSTYLIGNITEFTKNDILVTRDWYYPIDRSFETEIEVSGSTDSFFGKTIAKIFSKEQALAYWNLNYANVLE